MYTRLLVFRWASAYPIVAYGCTFVPPGLTSIPLGATNTPYASSMTHGSTAGSPAGSQVKPSELSASPPFPPSEGAGPSLLTSEALPLSGVGGTLPSLAAWASRTQAAASPTQIAAEKAALLQPGSPSAPAPPVNATSAHANTMRVRFSTSDLRSYDVGPLQRRGAFRRCSLGGQRHLTDGLP